MVEDSIQILDREGRLLTAERGKPTEEIDDTIKLCKLIT